MSGFETSLIKFPIQCEVISQKMRLVSHTVGFRGSQAIFSPILTCFLPFIHMAHGLPDCPLCSFVVSSLTNESLLPLLPSVRPSSIWSRLSVHSCYQSQSSVLEGGLVSCCRWSAEDQHQEALLSAATPELPKVKKPVAETTKAGFWMYMACTVLLVHTGQHKVRRGRICSVLYTYQITHTLLFCSTLGFSLVLSKLHWADTNLWTLLIDTAGKEPVSR